MFFQVNVTTHQDTLFEFLRPLISMTCLQFSSSFTSGGSGLGGFTGSVLKFGYRGAVLPMGFSPHQVHHIQWDRGKTMECSWGWKGLYPTFFPISVMCSLKKASVLCVIAASNLLSDLQLRVDFLIGETLLRTTLRLWNPKSLSL